MMTKEKNQKGQMFVGMVLLIGSIIAVVGLLLLFFSGSLIGTSYGVKAEAVAQAAATAGAEDALLRVERNTFSSFPVTYTLPVVSTTATVNVNTNTPSSGFVTVTSSATFSNHMKVLRVVLSVSSSTQVSVVSWTQVQ
jgi:Flp pilus assembly protein TadG